MTKGKTYLRKPNTGSGAPKTPHLLTPDLWVLIVASMYLVAAGYVFAYLYHFNVVDDAYISFRYAQNWALGRGVVFNPGERVEGYTNFLWVALLAPLYSATQAAKIDFTKAVMVVGVLFSLGNLALTFLLGRRLFRGAWWATSLALALLVLDNSFVAYAVSGLENPMLTFFFLLAAYLWVRQPPRAWLWTGLALAAMNMTRPDAALAAATFGVSSLFALGSRGNRSSPRVTSDDVQGAPSFRDAMLALGVWAVVYGAYFLWRYHYYGWLLPNTFYLKVGATLEGFQRGEEYLRTFFADRLYLPLLAAVAVLWTRRNVIRWLWLYALFHLVYIAYVGGDFYTGHRFLVVLQPVLALLAAFPVARLGLWLSRGRKERPWLQQTSVWWGGATLGGLVATYLLVAYAVVGYRVGPFTMEIKRWGTVVERNVRYQKWLRGFAKPGSSIALGDIGATGFFADLKVIDMLGVVDTHVAHQHVEHFGRGKPGHEKLASVDYALSRHPKYIKWGWWVSGDPRQYGYYIYNEFPVGLLFVDGLWVKEDLPKGHVVPGSVVGFQPRDLAGWRREGRAFDRAPSLRKTANQLPVFGNNAWFINSYDAENADGDTGRMVSEPIALRGDKMILSVGGGYDPERLRVSLLVNGRRVRNATGSQGEVLGRRAWEISSFRGQLGRIEIVDACRGPWGHILVDSVYQWRVD